MAPLVTHLVFTVCAKTCAIAGSAGFPVFRDHTALATLSEDGMGPAIVHAIDVCKQCKDLWWFKTIASSPRVQPEDAAGKIRFGIGIEGTLVEESLPVLGEFFVTPVTTLSTWATSVGLIAVLPSRMEAAASVAVSGESGCGRIS